MTIPADGSRSSFDVGRALREAREGLGLTLSEVAEDTKIQRRYLEALEENGPDERFPAPVYARFFLRSYASYLRSDTAPLLEAFDASHRETEPALEKIPGVRARPRRGWGGIVLAALSVLALMGLAVVTVSSNEGMPRLRPAAQGSALAGAGPTQAPPTPTRRATPAPIRGVRAVIRVSSLCWVHASADGRTVLAKTLPPGRSVVFRAKRNLVLTLGNAGGADLLVNGRKVRTGAPGEVVRLSLHRQHGRVVVAR